MLSFSQYKTYYEKYGKTPNQLNAPKKRLNLNQLQRRYEKYVRAENRKMEKQKEYQETQKVHNVEKAQQVDEKWKKVRKQVFKRDHYQCQLLPRMPNEYIELRNRLGPLDPCHVFRRSTHPFLTYDPNNIVVLHRLFHNRLDQYRHPFTGELISYDETYEWWRTIIGSKRFVQLKEKINEYKK